MTPSSHNLNAKLSPRPRKITLRVAATNRHLARLAAPAPVRVGGGPSAYRGGYLIDV